MPLRKPPIVEMWVEFTFDPGPKSTSASAVAFFQSYVEDYPELEFATEDWLEFRQTSPKQLPKVVGRTVATKHIRGHSKDGSRWMQTTPTQLVCNFLRLGEQYPGFDALAREAVARLDRYAETCGPEKLLSAAIHYVDVVTLPVEKTTETNLADYFSIVADVPSKVFGPQREYVLKTTSYPSDGIGPLEISLQHQFPDSGPEGLRFRLDWHKFCLNTFEVFDSSEKKSEAILSVLLKAHESVMSCFRAVFTDRAWLLFDPTE